MTFLREGRPLGLDKQALLTGAGFRETADLSHAEFREASFIGAEFEVASFVNAEFKGKVDFRCELQRGKLHESGIRESGL